MIALDPATNIVLSYQELLTILEETGAIARLIQEGYNVTAVTAAVPTSEPIESDNSSTLTGGVVGGCLAVLTVVVFISTVIVILLYHRRRHKR